MKLNNKGEFILIDNFAILVSHLGILYVLWLLFRSRDTD